MVRLLTLGPKHAPAAEAVVPVVAQLLRRSPTLLGASRWQSALERTSARSAAVRFGSAVLHAESTSVNGFAELTSADGSPAAAAP